MEPASLALTDKATIVPGPVPGLELWKTPVASIHKALQEVRPHFRRSANKSASDMFEVGWSFHALDQEQMMRLANPLTRFPCLHTLVRQAVQALSQGETFSNDTLNIICRRYSPGQGLPKHKDRPQLFEEDVYGCVLLNTSDKALTFEQTTRSGEVIAGPHHLEEQPGLCFKSRGPSRYDWVHGVEELTRGERISITWRWFQVDVAAEGHKVAKSKGEQKGKGKSKGKGKRDGNDARSQGELQREVPGGNPKQFPSQPSEEKAALVIGQPIVDISAQGRSGLADEFHDADPISTAAAPNEAKRRWGRK